MRHPVLTRLNEAMITWHKDHVSSCDIDHPWGHMPDTVVVSPDVRSLLREAATARGDQPTKHPEREFGGEPHFYDLTIETDVSKTDYLVLEQRSP